MSIHFAASRRHSGSALARHLHVPRGLRAVNDNYGADTPALIDNPLLRATLEHFAAHGLGAAAQARHEAERAHGDRDQESYRHWTSVCRLLDREMAARLVRARRRRGLDQVLEG